MSTVEKLMATSWLSGKKHVSTWLIFLVALVGVAGPS